MSSDLLVELLGSERSGRAPIKAVITVDLYGQCADYDRIEPACERFGATLIEDAAEALGASYKGRAAGSFGEAAALSFNGNKIITTSGGGALVTDDPDYAIKSRFLATQARDPAPHYQHTELGFNYRMSNLLAAVGRAQLADLHRRVARRRDHNRFYRAALDDVAGVEFMPEPEGSRSTFWLTALTIDPELAGADRDTVRLHLESLDVEARPVWKPMHLQPFYAECQMVGGSVCGPSVPERALPAERFDPRGRSTGDDRRGDPEGASRRVSWVLHYEGAAEWDTVWYGNRLAGVKAADDIVPVPAGALPAPS